MSGAEGSSASATDFDTDALREVPRSSATSGYTLGWERPIQSRWLDGFADYLHDPYIEIGCSSVRPRPTTSTVAVIGGGFAGSDRGPAARRRASTASASSRKAVTSGVRGTGTVSGRACDVESFVYLPDAGGNGLSTDREVRPAAEIHAHCRHRHASSCTPRCLFHRGHGFEWDVSHRRWLVGTNRDDRLSARFLVVGTGPSPPQAAGYPRHREFRGSHVSHQPLGLRIYGRQCGRGPHRPRRQGCRDHRHGLDGHPGLPHLAASAGGSTSSSAPRPRSMCGPTDRRIRPGPPPSSPGGSARCRAERVVGERERPVRAGDGERGGGVREGLVVHGRPGAVRVLRPLLNLQADIRPGLELQLALELHVHRLGELEVERDGTGTTPTVNQNVATWVLSHGLPVGVL